MAVLLAVLSSQSIPMSPILAFSYSPLLKKSFLHQQHVRMLPPTRLDMQYVNNNHSTLVTTSSNGNILLTDKDTSKSKDNNKRGTNIEGSYYKEQREIVKSKLNKCLKAIDEKKKRNEKYTRK